VGGLLVLLTATALSIYKPWGMTAYGRRKQLEVVVPPVARVQGSSRRGLYFLLGIIGLVLLLLLLHHLAGGGLRHH
jgi:hypothetical protein